jgi:beta-phosphoglucomutase-like phosphatase (HAD superfamily)
VARPKPAPDVYLQAARALGIPPRHCIVFEDSPVGVESARAAGMRVVGILTHPSALDDIQFAVSDFMDPNLERWLSEQRAE